VESGNATCVGVSAKEVVHVKAWHTFTQAYSAGQETMPVTALLVALHNMISESVEAAFQKPERRQFDCPAAVLAGLKTGLLSGDQQVASFSLPTYTAVPGVPGLAATHESVSC